MRQGEGDGVHLRRETPVELSSTSNTRSSVRETPVELSFDQVAKI